MSDVQFSTPDKFNKDKNFVQVKIGEKKPVLDVELNEMQKIQMEALAELYRQQTHSGVIDYDSNIHFMVDSTKSKLGSINSVQPSNSVNFANSIMVYPFNVLMNGYKFLVSNDGSTNISAGRIQYALPTAPTFGTRDDLVFLEAWFEEIDSVEDPSIIDARIGVETSRRIKLNSRIRTVAGVDFVNFPEGLGTKWMNGATNYQVLPQGGRSLPITSSELSSLPMNPSLGSNITYGFKYSGNKNLGNNNPINSTLLKDFDDMGLYVAGEGSQASKDVLKTVDGYVYAIPLFRVKRRNSGGYREDNLNGAVNYKGIIESRAWTPAITNGQTVQVQFDAKDYVNLKIGEEYRNYKQMMYGFVVVSLDGDNKATIRASIRDNSLAMGSVNNEYTIPSDRPDGKYVNIIDKDDIIDLRHKVSLTGINYQQLLEENFDKLLRGELQTKDKTVTVKNRYGLKRAPLGLKQELVPQKVLGDDGVERELINLTPTFNNWGSHQSGNTVLSPTKLQTVNTAVSKTNKISVKPNTPYLVQVITNSDRFVVFSYRADGSSGAFYNADTRTNQKAKFITASDITHVEIHAYSSVSGTFTHENPRLYEIDQATYDKIDVDLEFTGNKLAKKFPYVSSYPNFVENLFVGGLTSGDISLTDSTNIANSSRVRTDFIPVLPNTQYILTSKASMTRAVSYDINKNVISTFVFPFTTQSNASFIRVSFDSTNTDEKSLEVLLEKGNVKGIYIPSGRWFLPNDYAEGKTKTEVSRRFSEQRSNFSDAQISEVVNDIIEPLKTPQPHIQVTQTTEGTWAVGDTIKIKSTDGIITGVIDSDTALARITKWISSSVYEVDDVSKIVVNDTFMLLNNVTGAVSASSRTITAIDTATKQITVSGGTLTESEAKDWLLIETTASTSSPTVRIIKNDGTPNGSGFITWSGLGTKEVTGTLGTPVAEMDKTKPLQVTYSVSYPSGQGIENVPTEVHEAKVNEQKLVKVSDNIVRVKANFNGKIPANMDLVPHIAKYTHNTTLQAPSGTWITSDDNVTGYSQIYALDGVLRSTSNSTNGNIAQALYSFDITRILVDKFGEGIFSDCLTTSDRVAKAKVIVTKINLKWYGNGSSPTGTKASVSWWNITSGQWSSPVVITSVGGGVNRDTSISALIDTNGFIHFLAYADASDGLTASTINTDYVELEVELNVAETGYEVLVPENQFPVLSENMLLASQAFLNDSSSLSVINGGVLNVISNGELELIAGASATNWARADFRSARLKDEYYTISLQAKSGTSSKLGIGMGSVTDGENKSYDLTSDWKTYTRIVKQSADQDFLAIYPNTPGSVSVGDSIFIRNLKLERGSNPNPKWSSGRKKKSIMNFLGKVVGSTVENPHKFTVFSSSSFPTTPTQSTFEPTQGDYNTIFKQDGGLKISSMSTTGGYAQHVFEFDLSHLGLSLKELKSALRKLSVSWTGYGKGDNAGVLAYGATQKLWRNSDSVWALGGAGNTSSTPSTNYSVVTNNGGSNDVALFVTKDQKVYVLIHSTYPASASNSSEIYTDYVKLEVELADYVDYVKGNVVKVRKETKEAKLQYPAKSHRLLGNGGASDMVELFYKTLPHQGLRNGFGKVLAVHDKILVTGRGTGFLSSFSDFGDDRGLLYVTNTANTLYNTGASKQPYEINGSFNLNALTGRTDLGNVKEMFFSITDFKKYREKYHHISEIIGGTLTAYDGGYFDKHGRNRFVSFELTDVKMKAAGQFIIVAPVLMEVSGELQLMILSLQYSATNGIIIADTDNAEFWHTNVKIDGRPLVKGVN